MAACHPLWVRQKSGVGITCKCCKDQQRRCTLSLEDLGILVPPTVVGTSVPPPFRDGMANPSWPVQERKQKTLKPTVKDKDNKGDEGDKLEIGEEEGASLTQGGVQMSVLLQGTEDAVPSNVERVGEIENIESVGKIENIGKVKHIENIGRARQGKVATGVASVANVDTQVSEMLGDSLFNTGIVPALVRGRTHTVFHQDVSYISNELINPARSVATLEQARLELWGITQWEREQQSHIHELTRRRKAMWRGLSKHFKQEIQRLGGHSYYREIGVGTSDMGGGEGTEKVESINQRDKDVEMSVDE